MIMEKWKSINELDGYEVSNLGRVRRLKVDGSYNYLKGHIRKGKGYRLISVKGRNYRVHRLVAKAFVDGMSDVRCDVNHLDGNKLNNSADNLQWVTNHENNYHSMYSLGRSGNIEVVAYNDSGKKVAEFISISQAKKFGIGDRNLMPKSEYSVEAALSKLNKPRKKYQYKIPRVSGEQDFSKTCDPLLANMVMIDIRNGVTYKDIIKEYGLSYYKINMIKKSFSRK